MLNHTRTMYIAAFVSLIIIHYSSAHETACNTPQNEQSSHIKEKIQQELQSCDYAPACIQSLDLAYPETSLDRQILDEVLIKYYYDQAKNALKTKTPQQQIFFLDYEITKCLLSPGAIERGAEGPCLVSTNDGSDRGAHGRRCKALNQLKKEIEHEQG